MTPTFAELVSMLAHGMGHAALYGAKHPRVRAAAEQFAVGLEAVLAERGQRARFLGVAEAGLVDEGRLLLGSTLLGQRIVEFSQSLHCGGFLFHRGVSTAQAQGLLELAAQLREPTADLDEARALFTSMDLRDIELSPHYQDPAWFGQFLFECEDSLASEISSQGDGVPVYQDLFRAVERAHADAVRDRAFDLDGTRSTSERLVQSTADGPHELLPLLRYPDFDNYTVGHSVRVAVLAVMVGRRCGLSEERLVELGAAGLLHDVGKAKIPDEILYKRGRLDDAERAEMSHHPALGARMLLENRDIRPMSVAAAWGHHLRHDGAGYPATASWASRSRSAALIQVCDVFEALTAIRPYKPAFTPRRTYEIMLADRGAFDPTVFSALVRTIGLYPPGSRVRLLDGRGATVLAAGDELRRPRVRSDAGEELDLAHPDFEGLGIDDLEEAVGAPRGEAADEDHPPRSASSHACG